MDNWLQRHIHLNVDEAALVVAVVIPILSLLLPGSRRVVIRLLSQLALLAGRPEARYRAWFVREFGVLKNIYLNRLERLDLAETYISLSVQSDASSHGSRLPATHVMAPSGPRRIILVGDPGTGKSTLLKAYGSGVLRRQKGSVTSESDLTSIVTTNEFPVFIALRQVSQLIHGGISLEDHVIGIIQRHAATGASNNLFKRLLLKGRLLVLMDGLDEVSREAYPSVRAAIHKFAARSEDGDLPTSMARIIITCRKQNFFQIQEDWIGPFAEQYFIIAPLRDREIARFVSKRSDHFSAEKTQDKFLTDIKVSQTLELHRIPLILTISLGLYTQLVGYDIPTSMNAFYDEMIRELLRRHDFRSDDRVSLNQFRADDKQRFLREFAQQMAQRIVPFADFLYIQILDSCYRLQPSMPRLGSGQVKEFVNEIIDRSGILTQTSDDDSYAYAHRAFHEYFVATDLLRDVNSGTPFLLERASDPQWRQTIIFFCAYSDSTHAAPFIEQLASKNLELAGQCLAVAHVPDELAEDLINKLGGGLVSARHSHATTMSLLSALIQATHSPSDRTRSKALAKLEKELIVIANNGPTNDQREISRALFGDELSVASTLLHSMARNSGMVVARAIAILANAMPDDERGIIAPLWGCLSVPGMAHTPTARSIVRRLLVLAMDPNLFAELQGLPSIRLEWVPESHRLMAYPLRKGLPNDSNLVTLLGCAHTLKATDNLPERNTYLQALEAPGQPLRYLDRKVPWYTKIPTYAIIRLVTYTAFIISLVAAVLAIAMHGNEIASDSSSVRALIGGHVLTTILVAGITWIAMAKYERHSYYGPFSWTAYLIPAKSGAASFSIPTFLEFPQIYLHPRPAGILGGIIRFPLIAFLSTAHLPVSLTYGIPIIAWTPLPDSIVLFLLPLLVLILFWLPSTELCGRFGGLSWRTSQKFILGVLNDNRSRHWVVPQSN